MKKRLFLILLLSAVVACYSEEGAGKTSISGEDLKYILAMYDDIHEYPMYVFENNRTRLKEIEVAAGNIDFETYAPKDSEDVAWYRFYKDFADGRFYIHTLNLSDYKIEVSRSGGKVFVYMKSLDKNEYEFFKYCFDNEGKILERYFKGSPLRPSRGSKG